MRTIHLRLRGAVLALAFAATTGAGAQLLIDPDPGWQEGAVPPPPEYSAQHLIEVEMPSFSSIKLGIDPKTIALDRTTGVVRYVVVARGPSALNALYEGVRCTTGEYRIYAHQVQGAAWVESTRSDWKAMTGEGGIMVRHPYQLARNGLCVGTTPRSSVREMVRELRSNNASLYR